MSGVTYEEYLGARKKTPCRGPMVTENPLDILIFECIAVWSTDYWRGTSLDFQIDFLLRLV